MKRLLLLAAIVLVIVSCGHRPLPNAAGPPLRLVIAPPFAWASLGQKIQFTAFARSGTLQWSVQGGSRNGLISQDGLYQAPYSDPGSQTIAVLAVADTDTATAAIHLSVSSADTAACRGPHQDHLPVPGEYVYVDELPVATTIVAPVYPDIAREAGVQGTVVVNALVCASGTIIDTRMASSIPMLDAAAMDAVRWWIFSPARINGSPVAVWVAIPVRFSLHAPS